MAPATHRRRDSEHKNIKCTAKGLSLSAWLTCRGFSNILAVFSLYKICKMAIAQLKLFTGYICMYVVETYLQSSSARVPKFEAAILMSCDDNLRVTARSWRPFSAWNGPLALWEASFFTCRCATNLKQRMKERKREKARDENTVEREIKLRGNPSKQWGNPSKLCLNPKCFKREINGVFHAS